MKALITGNSAGIGLALEKEFKSRGYKIYGISIETGYDLTKPDILDKIKQFHNRCDVLVNNAYADDAQTELFVHYYKQWRLNSNKTIINMSSMIKYQPTFGNKYVRVKKEMFKEWKEIINNDPERKCRIINVSPHFVDTYFFNGGPLSDPSMPKLDAKDVARTTMWAFDQTDIEIGEVCVSARNTD